MLMYGFQPESPVTMDLANEKIQQVKDFLEDHQEMLRWARQNVRQAQDRYKKFSDEKRQQVVFEKDDLVFLRVPEHSKTLRTGPVPKLSPRYCGPFRVIKRLGNVAYKLELPETSQVHPVFHVSRLRKRLHDGDNVVDTGVLVEYIEPPVEPHEPEKILDHHELRTRHHVRNKQVLVKWKDRPDEGSTWENASTI